MQNLLIEQRNAHGLLKTWRLRFDPKKESRFLFGKSKHVDLRSVDTSVHGVEGAFEYRGDHWVYINLDLRLDNAGDPIEIILKQNVELKVGACILRVTPFADKEKLQGQMARIPALTDSELQKSKLQLYVVRCNGQILSTKIIKQSQVFIVPGTDQAVPMVRSADWQIQNIAIYEVHQRSVLAESDMVRALTKEKLLAKEGRGPVYATLVGMAVLACLFVLSPTAQNAGEVAKHQAMPLVYREIKLPPPQKLKMQTVAVQQPTAEPPAAAAAENGGGHLQAIKSLGGTSRLSKLLGKISAGAAKSSNVIITNGVKAGSGESGRALAAIGNADRSGKDWSAEGKGQSVKVGTIGSGGKGAVDSMGNLKAGKTGTGGAELLEDESEIVGGLDREIIAQYIRTQLGQILYCYERQLSATPDLFGKVAIRFTIGSKGEVETQRIGDSTLRNATVEGCILQRVAKWKFPAPEGGTKVNVTYPFLFKSTN